MTTKDISLRISAEDADAQKTLEGLSSAFEEMIKSSRGVDKSLDASAGSIDKLTTRLTRLQSVYSQLSKKNALADSFRKQGKELLALRRKYSDAQNAARAAASAQRDGAKGSEAALKRSVKTVRAVASAYEKKLASVRKVKGELNEAGVSTTKLGSTQKRLGSLLGRVSKEIEKTRAATDKHTAAQQRASKTQTQLRKQGNKTLSFYRRLRTEIGSLVAAYAGFYAIGQGVSSVVDTADTLEAARTRFSIGFGGDAKAVASEMEFVRQTADDLKLDFRALAESYSQFVVAVPKGQFAIKDLRGIFEGVTVAARVNRLTIEQQKGVFNALTQIISKGVVTMEELRQQLGDRLAGAVESYATSIGFGTAEFLKFVQAGDIGTETLVDFSSYLKEKFGPGLEDALKSPAARIQAFRNTLTELSVSLIDSGFVENLITGLDRLTKKLSEAGTQAGLITLSNLLLKAADGALFLVEHIELLIPVLGALIGLKAGKIFASLALGLSTSVLKVGALTTAIGSAGGLLAYIKLLLPTISALAGPLGLAAGAAIGLYFAFRNSGPPIDDYTERLQKLRETVGELEKDNLEQQLKDTTSQIKENEQALLDIQKERARLANRKKITVLAPGSVYDASGETALKNLEEQARIAQKRLVNLREELVLVNEEIEGRAEQEITDRNLTGQRIRLQSGLKSIESRLKKLREEEQKFTEQSATSVAERFAVVAKQYDVLRKSLEELSDSEDERSKETANTGLMKLDKLLVEERKAIQRQFNKASEDNAKKRAEKLGRINDQIAEKEADTLTRRLDLIRREYAAFIRELESVGNREGVSLVGKLVGIEQQEEIKRFVGAAVSGIEDEISRAQIASADERTSIISDKYNQLIAELKGIASQDILNSVALQRDTAILSGMQEEINQTLERRTQLLETIRLEQEAGLISQADAQTRIKQFNAEVVPGMRELVDEAIAFAEAMGNESMVLNLRAMRAELETTKKQVVITGEQINNTFADSLVSAWDGFISGAKSAKDTFKQFASDFLKQIAQMILRQTALNLLQSSGFGGAIAGAINHDGGVVGGSTARSRRVSSGVFAYANRMPSGGVAGLKSNEVATILEKGEEVLPKNNPRHIANAGRGQQPSGKTPLNVNVVNNIDSASVVADGLAGADGDVMILNKVKANKSAIKQILGG